MKPYEITKDPAFPVMAMDILSNVLSRADNPGELGTYLTEEIRELTGARCVLIIQCPNSATVAPHRVVGANPLKRREWAESPAARRLYDVVHTMPVPQYWRGDEPFEVAGLLRQEGFELSMVFPLNAGAFRVGGMLVLGLPDEEHVSSVLDLLNNLSTIVALVLRNLFLFERQEKLIREHNEELQIELAERKRAEAEIKRLNADLEKTVEARIAELRAANTELDSFAYAVSHNLRAPLRAMSGFSQALKEDYGDHLDGDALGYLDQISLASRHMNELIDGLLTLSRSTRGELKQEALDISAMAERLLAEMIAAEQARRVAWTVEPGMQAQGDATMIEVVMRNLIDNAWKYTGKTPDATIRVYTGDSEGQRCFCVSDNGAGFDRAHAGKLFQPFQRLHRQEEFPGIGIGLATVQRIVHRHGGAIWAEGAPDQGATFCFTLHNPRPLERETS